MRIVAILGLVSCSAFLVAGCGGDGADCCPVHEHSNGEKAAAITEQTSCPVMEGMAIDRNLYVDHEGQRVYVCCRPCLDEVRANPAKYIQQLEDEGVTLERVNVEHKHDDSEEGCCPGH